MPEYLVFSPEGGEDDFEHCIIEANSAEAAIERYHLYRVPNDEILWGDVMDRSINSGLVQSLVLSTDEEENRFSECGEYSWNKAIIRGRVFEYFPNHEWAQLYADYLLSDEDQPEVPDFPHEMLAYIRGQDNFTVVTAIPLSEIPRF